MSSKEQKYFIESNDRLALTIHAIAMDSLNDATNAFHSMKDLLDDQASNLNNIIYYMMRARMHTTHPMLLQTVMAYTMQKYVLLNGPDDINLERSVALIVHSLRYLAKTCPQSTYEAAQKAHEACISTSRFDLARLIEDKALDILPTMIEHKDQLGDPQMLACFLMEQHGIAWTQIMIDDTTFRCKEFTFTAHGLSKTDTGAQERPLAMAAQRHLKVAA